MAVVAVSDLCDRDADPAETGVVYLGGTGWCGAACHCFGGSDFAKTGASDGGGRRAAESVWNRNVSLCRSVRHAVFIYLGAASMEGWQGISNAEASQILGANVEQTVGTDTNQISDANVVQDIGTESSVTSGTDADTASEEFTEEELQAICSNRLYRCDKLTDTKKDCNALLFYGQQSANMYSSVTNPLYQNFYYNIVKMPIQINNRTALLEERNPLFAQLMGERYILTTENKMPSGYSVLQQKGK